MLHGHCYRYNGQDLVINLQALMSIRWNLQLISLRLALLALLALLERCDFLKAACSRVLKICLMVRF